MPQVFQVLKCYKCSVFQIHQTKKSNKFECKMCGEKQSIKRHYGIGTGKDCRMHVQKLNTLRGNLDDNKTNTDSNNDEKYKDVEEEKIPEDIENPKVNTVKQSKWTAFIDKENEVEEIQEAMFLGDREVVLEPPQKKRTCKFKSKAKTKDSQEYLSNVKNNFKSDSKPILVNKTNIFDDSELEEVPEYETRISHQDRINCKNMSKLIVMEKSKEEKEVVSQIIKRNSKWVQYVDTEEDDTQGDELLDQDSKECVSNSENLFSLCDDNELDHILDI